MPQASLIHSSLSGRKVGALRNFDSKQYKSLSKLGIHFSHDSLNKINARVREKKFGMDALQPTVTTASMPIPVQFLQEWLPGFVFIVTAARRADEIMGIQTTGDWWDEQIVQGVQEVLGSAIPYGDYSNVPYADWNTNWVTRTVVRFEEGLRVGMLEEMRAGQVNIDAAAAKREGAALSLEIMRNYIAFYGYNNGLNQTYGFFTDPQLPAYVPVVPGASMSTLWSTKTFLEICNDVRTMVATLRTQAQDVVDPERVDLTLVLPTSVVDYLSQISDFGISVRDWMKDAYPRMRVVSAPELEDANGDENVAYLEAEKISDMSTDDGNVWAQLVPAKFMVVGVAKYEKYYSEDYLNATAGAMLKRPYALTRATGI